jgi:hypothetical protein
VANAGDSADCTTGQIRRIARIWSAVIIGFTLLSIIAHVVMPDTNPADYPPSENLLPLAMCLSVAGLGVAWRWEGMGGAVNAGFFLANLGLYWVIRGKFFPSRALAIFSLELIPGILFLVCWWRTRSRNHPL